MEVEHAAPMKFDLCVRAATAKPEFEVMLKSAKKSFGK